MKPTIGRIVHFYDFTLAADANNSVGPGPYAAIVTQVFAGPYVNLKVFVPFGDDRHEGSVAEKTGGTPASRYWTWPPLTPPAAPIGVAYGDRI